MIIEMRKKAKMLSEWRAGFESGMKLGYMEGVAAGRFLASEKYIKEKIAQKLK